MHFSIVCLLNVKYVYKNHKYSNQRVSRSSYAKNASFCSVHIYTVIINESDEKFYLPQLLFLLGVPKISLPEIILFRAVKPKTARKGICFF